MSSTHIRIPEEVKRKLDNLSQNGESVGSVIARLISYYENAGSVNNDVNIPVNSSPADLEALVNNAVNNKLTDIQEQVNSIVNSQLTQINERLDNLIPGIEHQRDEAGHALEIVFSIQKRLEALEAQPVTVPTLIPDDKPEEQTPGDDTDLRQEQEQDERDILIQKVKELKAGGMKLTQIAQAIGIGHSQLSKLMNREEHPNVNLKPEQKAALMNVPSQKSSPEGT